MKAWQLQDDFGVEHLAAVERPEEAPGPGQVLIGVRACSLNYRDLLMVRGHYNPKQPLPLVPLSDGAGEVLAVGPGVDRVRPGQRVAALFAQGWLSGPPTRATLGSTLGGPLDGMLMEQRVLPADGVCPVPAHLSDAQAATLPCAALTAWSALGGPGRCKRESTVLVQGTGGVSIFALQFACAMGARVIVTSSSDEKLERARQLGAWQTINYRSTPAWGDRARKLTEGAGVEQVIEVGGARTLAQSVRAIAPGGQISVIGVLSGAQSDFDITPVLMRAVRLQGVLVGHREGFEAMGAFMAAQQIEPVVDRVVPFAEAPSAFAHLASATHLGKVCVQVA